MSHILSYMLIFSIIEIGGTRPGLRIIGGNDADEDKYEFIVRLVYEIKYHVLSVTRYAFTCTGAVLNPIWTLTAAHCGTTKTISNVNMSILFVIQFNPKNYTWTPENMREVISMIRHPAWRPTLLIRRCDIALVKTKEIPLKQYARLSSLDFMTMVGQKVTIFGFGMACSSEIVSDTMALKIPLQMIEAIVTKCSYEISAILKPALCFARRCGKFAVVRKGDSGGPMLHASGIVAINSIGDLNQYGYYCHFQDSVPVYEDEALTPVSPFVDWISDTIETN